MWTFSPPHHDIQAERDGIENARREYERELELSRHQYDLEHAQHELKELKLKEKIDGERRKQLLNARMQCLYLPALAFMSTAAFASEHEDRCYWHYQVANVAQPHLSLANLKHIVLADGEAAGEESTDLSGLVELELVVGGAKPGGDDFQDYAQSRDVPDAEQLRVRSEFQ
ncbi:hypothetical protein PG994_005329 [Apiospora phragmitis]|uniref:Uncharacterized protein n=1 Tax=Apiospora phragmitis TaxID=2905665 RepID=A0ABR1VBX9_9PEZI